MKMPTDKNDEISLRDILTLMPGNVFWKDNNGKYLGVNNNIAKILNLSSPDDIIGKTNSDIMEPKYAIGLDKLDQECMLASEGRFIEEIGINIHQQPTNYFTQRHPLHNKKGEVIGLVGISMDITERKKIENELKLAKEKAEASNLAKSQFLAVVNHELRTPLTGILGLVEILKQHHVENQENRNIIADLDSCAQYLLTLVNDILDFTKLDANKADVELKQVDFNLLSNEAFSILGGLAKNKGLQLKRDIKKDLPIVQTDPKLFNQILINLINNAIKFTDSGYINLSINCQTISDQQIMLEIKVTDTGQGIPADKIDLIFEPFKQLEDTYIRQSSRSGTGLGLAIVKQLVQLLNCDIRVESVIGKGSTFTVTGKFNIATPEITPQDCSNLIVKEITPSAIKPRMQKIKTLLVEDDRIVQLIHRRMLTDLHCDIDLAHCGQEALSLLDKHDIAFVDIGLSDMTGFELIKAIREHQKKTQHIFPIIALTGYTGETEKSACIEAGANEVAVKPISIDKLGELLGKYC
ncbi:MAG: ATP-binding protein [Gammaproteobacteria bacterium]